ncbi:MAG TPA: nicotinate (nicotinamide) nucleotide adenylyltransferase [Bacillota bacterium]|nr:nicotinate (nicotinamide) nucleotide adenylyltransferase [Bacillota bacterium]HOK68503.1 nicotinate (nicotinamide) nucleotide adenylyltransferase [Bacillota bacterium]HPP85131.1 nicotinate (nicotinamide) nucleotide adenylyltransferase [Bacillota bacterium]
MKTGIFGGTFNPVHIGHVKAAIAFIREMQLDRLFVLPNFIPPLKDRESAPASDRLEMLKIAFLDVKNAIIDDFELKSGGTSYTYKTIAHYKALYPDDRFYLLIGDDNLLIFRKWRNFEYILKNCVLCVAMRANMDIAEEKHILERDYGAQIHILQYSPTVISSTELRSKLLPEYLPDGVFEYIRQKGLYQ